MTQEKWSKKAKNFTVSLPGGGGVVGFGLTGFDWVGLGRTERVGLVGRVRRVGLIRRSKD
jgi:hypothetical protein